MTTQNAIPPDDAVRHPRRVERLLPLSSPAGPVTDPSPPETLAKPAELSWWDWAAFLLHTVAEIEHALLVQYLYAAYSLRTDLGSGVGPPGAENWRSIIVDIARQEMGHLLTEQNILRFIDAPLNFERQDFPFRSTLYPFVFTLEPLSKNTLSKYVAAEMPKAPGIPAAELDEILDRAGAVHGTPINRVGILFDTLVDVFADPTRLLDTDFRPQTAADLQGRPDDWMSFFGIIVETIATREQACAALRAIGEEGEGSGTTSPVDNSHFGRFLKLYRDFPDDASAPTLTRPVAVDPSTQFEPAPHPALEAARITHPSTRRWAQLHNLRYRMLLLDLAHSLQIPGPNTNPDGKPTTRGHLTNWTFNEMRTLQATADVLAERPRKPSPQAPGETAGPPFELPYTLALADNAHGRWRAHAALLDSSSELIAAIVADEGTTPILDSLITADNAARAVVSHELAQAE